MPNIKSASKRMRQNVTRRADNRMKRSTLRTSIKKLLQAVQAGDQAQAQEQLRGVVRLLDRSAKRNLVHPRNAARHISRLTHKVNAIGQSSAGESAS